MKNEILHKEGFFEGYDKTRLFYQEWIPNKSKASLIIIHGIGEHSSRYAHIGTYLGGLGFSVYAYDQRGNGRSSGRRGHIKKFEEYLLDLKVFIEYLSLNIKPYILGHSLGGLVSIYFAMKYPQYIAGLITTSPALGLSMHIPIYKIIIAYFLNLFYPRHTLTDNTVSSRYLSHDSKVCDDYSRDPLVHRKRSVRFFVEFNKTTKTVRKRPYRLKTPSLFLQAGDDKIVCVDVLKKFFEAVPTKPKTLRIYPGFYHEILNEIEKEKVLRDIQEWFAALGVE